MLSQGLDQAAVDEDVTAGDVGTAAAGEEDDEVGDFVGRVNRPVDVPAAACSTTARGSRLFAPPTVAATPWSPSHRSVSTGPGLTVFTRTPRGPSSLDSALQKLLSAAFAAQ